MARSQARVRPDPGGIGWTQELLLGLPSGGRDPGQRRGLIPGIAVASNSPCPAAPRFVLLDFTFFLLDTQGELLSPGSLP